MILAVLDSLHDYYDTITQLLWELLGLVNEFYYGIVCPLYELLGTGVCPALPGEILINGLCSVVV